MPLNRPLFRRSIVEALADLLGQHFTTAKQVARAIEIDPATAENLRKGKLSVSTLQNAALIMGRELWEQLGDEIYGETYLEYKERQVETILQKAENAQNNVARIRRATDRILSGAPELDGPVVGSSPDQQRGAESRSWARPDRQGRRTSSRTRNGA